MRNAYHILAEEESTASEVQIRDGGHADCVLLQLVRHRRGLRVLGDQHVVGQHSRTVRNQFTAFLKQKMMPTADKEILENLAVSPSGIGDAYTV